MSDIANVTTETSIAALDTAMPETEAKPAREPRKLPAKPAKAKAPAMTRDQVARDLARLEAEDKAAKAAAAERKAKLMALTQAKRDLGMTRTRDGGTTATAKDILINSPNLAGDSYANAVNKALPREKQKANLRSTTDTIRTDMMHTLRALVRNKVTDYKKLLRALEAGTRR